MRGNHGTGSGTGRPNTVLVVGYAKLPEETAAQTVYQTLGLALEVETEGGAILAADCTLVPPLACDFLSRILVGLRLPQDLERAIGEISLRYVGPAQGALIAALRAAGDRWESHTAKAD